MNRIFLLILFLTLGLYTANAQEKTEIQQWYETALAHHDAGKYPEAIEMYTKVIDAGGYELCYYLRSDCYFKLDSTELGLADMKTETTIYPNNAKIWAKYGFFLFLYSDTSKGIDEIRHSIKLDSLDFFGWMAGGIYFGYNDQFDSMEKWNNIALNLLTDSADIDEFYKYYDLFNENFKPFLALEGKRIKRQYNINYASYIPSNRNYVLAYYYVEQQDVENTVNAMIYLYGTESVLPYPRKYRLYLPFNYFTLMGNYIYQKGDYALGKQCLDLQFSIAEVINNNIVFARAWSSKGSIYYYQVKYDSALWAYRTAEKYYNKEPFDSSIAAVYTMLATIYTSKTQYDTAEMYAKKALLVCGKNDNVTLSISMNNLGMLYQKKGDFTESKKYYEAAVKYGIEKKDTANLTLFYNNLGNIYQSTAEYDISEKYFLMALSINGDNHPNLATIYSNLGYLHIMWGNFPTAIDYCNKALKEAMDNNITDKLGLIYNNLSLCYRNSGNYEEAIKILHQSIAISEQLGLKDMIALNYNNLALYYSETDKYDSALYYQKKSLEMNLALNSVSELGTNYANIGATFLKTDEYDSALYYTQRAIEYDLQAKRTDRISTYYSNLATIYFYKENYAKSEIYFKKTIELLEEIRRTATGAVRREYLSQVIFNYQLLAYVEMKLKNYEAAFETMELSKAKLLGEQLSTTGVFKPITLADVESKLDDSTAVYFFSSLFKNGALGLIIDKKSISQISFKGDSLVNNFNNLISAVPDESTSMEEILKYYRSLLLIPQVASRGSELLEAPAAAASPEMREKVSRLLYSYFFDDIKNKLPKYNTLIIVPDGAINFLPFESLLDSSNHYLAENLNIGYVQSLSIEQTIAKRVYSATRKQMLAFGGAIYKTTAPIAKVQTKEAREAITNEAAKAVASRGPLTDSYAKLGYGSWDNLPGTTAEVEKLKNMIPSSDVYQAAEVNEKKIKALSSNGELRNYKVIHFATHGMVVPEVPELSALVLSQIQSDTSEDNYLRADEISRLKMNADFVALSACETGLGKIYKGDGVVGLTQSFMIAGANSLAVSLWQVADESTSQFMTGIYGLSKIDNNYLKALNAVKRKFIAGEYGEKYKPPYFWAPFVYYGKFHLN